MKSPWFWFQLKATPAALKKSCSISDELAKVFIANKATDALACNVSTICNEVGLTILRRALIKYKASAQYKAVELSAEELFAYLDVLKGEADQEKTQE